MDILPTVDVRACSILVIGSKDGALYFPTSDQPGVAGKDVV